MAGVLQHLRSSTLNKRPNPASMVDGQLAINYASGSPGAFFKDTNGNLVKVGPVHVGSSAPNVSPASGGTAGNSLGEQWLDTSGGTYVFKIWDGGAWRSEAGEFVNVTGDTMTGALGIIAGSASTPGLFFSGDANSGLYSPGADQLAISTSGAQRLVVNASGNVGIGSSGPVSKLEVINPGVATLYVGYNNTSENYYDANTHIFRAGNSADERLRITSSGLVGVGTSSPGALLEANGGDIRMVNTNGRIYLQNGNTSGGAKIGVRGTSGTTNGYLAFETNDIEFARFDSSGRLGIGTTSPSGLIHGYINADAQLIFQNSSQNNLYLSGTNASYVADATGSSYPGYFLKVGGVAVGQITADGTNSFQLVGGAPNTPILFQQSTAERARIDSSGRLLVGTSTARANFFNSTASAGFQLEGTGTNRRAAIIGDDFEGSLILASQKSGAVGGNTVLASGDPIGALSFQGNDGSEFVEAATITAQVDGTPGANDMPGRIVLSTTADGASSPTERMRITNGGRILLTTTVESSLEAVDVNVGQRLSLCINATDSADRRNWRLQTETDALGDLCFRCSTTNTGGPTTTRVQFTSAGQAYNTTGTWGTLSDANLKQEIEDASSQWDDIKAVRFRKYRLKDEVINNENASHHLGVIAQELEQTSPGLVVDSENGVKSVKQSILLMKAAKALQEAMERIETLEQRLNDAGIN